MSISAEVGIDKRSMFSTWKNCDGDKVYCLCLDIFNSYGIDTNTMPEVVQEIKCFVATTCKYFKKLWVKCNRTEEHIFVRNQVYFDTPFKIPSSILEKIASLTSSSDPRRGRKVLPFEDSCEAVKRRKTSDLRSNYPTLELAYATQMKLRDEGMKEAAAIVQEATQASSSRAEKILTTSHTQSNNSINPYTAFEALALILDLNLTKYQYNKLRKDALQRNVDLYPSYYRIVQAKKSCYPDIHSMLVSDTLAEVKLEPLLEHTAKRLVEANSASLDDFSDEEIINLELTIKWGFDGTTGIKEHKQQFEDDDGTKSDASVFVTSIVPIKLASNDHVLFQNKRPSSTRYCRPLRIQYISETSESTLREKEYIDEQINKLTPLIIIQNGRTLKIKFKMLLTMVDGKAINSITSTKSAQTCYLCGATPTKMNNIDRVEERTVDENLLQYGLSTLHAWIRFYEYFIHLSYKLEVKKWQIRGADIAESVKNRKKNIQQRFKVEMGLIVDQPRSGGSGTSNDGNSARKFFQHTEKSAEITGLDPNVLKRCAAILQVMASGLEVNADKFHDYSLETARLLVRLYPWYHLPITIHKVLIHGSLVIKHFMIPIGQLSEEAQESRNKDLKRYRTDHTRKVSRTATNTDLLHRLLETSDPFITSLRENRTKPERPLCDDAKLLLDQQVVDD